MITLGCNEKQQELYMAPAVQTVEKVQLVLGFFVYFW